VKIYFAGSIRGGRDDWALYQQIIDVLGGYGTVFTEHIADSELSITGENVDDRYIHDRDLEWLRSCDCLVAEVTTPSLGVGYEIGKATEWGKRVLCLFRAESGRSLSAMIGGSSETTVREYATIEQLCRIVAAYFESWWK
jgi:nucleoside 2-deoxyribosyltransferase